MTNEQLAEVKAIADGLAAIGKPGHDNIPKAKARLALLERFERLVVQATKEDRHMIMVTLKEMLEDCNKRVVTNG